MAVQTEEENRLIQKKFEDLLACCTRCDSPDDKSLIIKAFNFANKAHKETRRKSGEPYIIHPIAVAKIVTHEIGLGAKSIISALLHDVVEDTDYTLEDIEHLFGKKIASIIDGLTKISGVFDNKSSLQAENFRKMLLTLSDDIRVILIKLADRLHNMRTLDALPPEKQMKIAGETSYLYAPMAHRLGLYAIKSELEDLSLKYRHPKVYEEISIKIKENEKQRYAVINKISLPIIEKLEQNNIVFDINGRPKSIYSIWKKMQEKNVPFYEIYDLLAIRIVFEAAPNIPEKAQCWNIYSLITDVYMPKPDRLRDWVSTPKANGYEALHATLMGPNGKWVEVQIRSKRMDEIAERGYAAHWKYKDINSHESELDKWIKKIRELLENPQSNALEFLDEFKMNLFSSEIIVFTPKGQLKILPKDATALDFAYEIHSEIGNKAIAAKVNHKLVGLNHILNSGDQIEILTSSKQKSQIEWLNYVVTARAKATIQNSLKAETKNRIKKGKSILENELKQINTVPSPKIIRNLVLEHNCTSKDELYSKVGSRIITLESLKKSLRKSAKNKWIRYWKLQFGKTTARNKKELSHDKAKVKDEKTLILKENIDEAVPVYNIAKCCNPIPGDDVIGYKNADKPVIIHKANCPIAIRLMSSHGDSIISTKWTTHKVLSFLARISVSGIDKIGIINSITTIISKELDVNIRNLNISSHDGIFDGTIDLYVHDITNLNNLIMNLSKIKGIESVKRMEIAEL